jgi:hypothetical protein
LTSASRGLLKSLLAEFSHPPPPWRLAEFLLQSDYFERARKDALEQKITLSRHVFASAERFSSLDVPRLATHGDLAAWLDLRTGELDWLADARRLQPATAVPRLSYYDYKFAPRAEGPPRLLEAPKSRLKAI